MGTFRNIFKSGEIYPDREDANEDFYNLIDMQYDHNYWHETIVHSITSLGTNDEKYIIIRGGEITFNTNGTLHISSGIGICTDAGGNPRMITIPALENISIPDGWNDGRRIWMIGEYESKYSTERRLHFNNMEYHYLLKDAYTGHDDTARFFTDRDPSGNTLIWGSFSVNGTVCTSLNGRSPELALHVMEKHRSNVVLDHPDNSVYYRHLNPEVKDTLHKKLVKYRGPHARLYPYHDSVDMYKVFNSDEPVEIVTRDGLPQDRDAQNQATPISLLKEAPVISTQNYSVMTTINETPDHQCIISRFMHMVPEHSMVAIHVGSVGSGYSHIRVELHDPLHTVLSYYEKPIADVINNWNYFSLPATLEENINYHYHVYVLNFTTGMTPQLSGGEKSPFACMVFFKPMPGKYGGNQSDDVIRLLLANGQPLVPVYTEKDEYNENTNLNDDTMFKINYVAADFSDVFLWSQWNPGDNYIGVDLKTGRIKLPPNIALTNIPLYVEFNVNITLDDLNAKGILNNTTNESLQDFYERTFPQDDTLIIKKIQSAGVTDARTIRGRCNTVPQLCNTLGLVHNSGNDIFFNYVSCTFQKFTPGNGYLWFVNKKASSPAISIFCYNIIDRYFKEYHPIINASGTTLSCSYAKCFTYAQNKLFILDRNYPYCFIVDFHTGITKLTFQHGINSLEYYNGLLYLANTNENSVYEYDLQGQLKKKYTLSKPKNIIVDGDYIYAINTNEIIDSTIYFDGISLWFLNLGALITTLNLQVYNIRNNVLTSFTYPTTSFTTDGKTYPVACARLRLNFNNTTPTCDYQFFKTIHGAITATFDGHNLWVGGGTIENGVYNKYIFVIDSDTMTIVRKIETYNDYLLEIHFDGNYVWGLFENSSSEQFFRCYVI